MAEFVDKNTDGLTKNSWPQIIQFAGITKWLLIFSKDNMLKHTITRYAMFLHSSSIQLLFFRGLTLNLIIFYPFTVYLTGMHNYFKSFIRRKKLASYTQHYCNQIKTGNHRKICLWRVAKGRQHTQLTGKASQ